MGIDTSALARKVEEDIRLTLIKALTFSPDVRLNENILREALDEFGHRRDSGYVLAQLRWLADNQIIKLEKAGSVHIATLLQKGLDHVERRRFAPGVRIPRLGL